MTITAEMIAPITEAINSALTVLVPVGLGIMGTMVGVSLVPKILYRFL